MDIEDEIRFAPFSSYEQSEKEERDPPDTTLIGNISNIGVAFSSSGTSDEEHPEDRELDDLSPAKPNTVANEGEGFFGNEKCCVS